MADSANKASTVPVKKVSVPFVFAFKTVIHNVNNSGKYNECKRYSKQTVSEQVPAPEIIRVRMVKKQYYVAYYFGRA